MASAYLTLGVDKVISQLPSSHIIIPMHFKTKAFDALPYSVDDFVEGKQHVKRINGNSFNLSPDNLPENREIVVLQYE